MVEVKKDKLQLLHTAASLKTRTPGFIQNRSF